jgi:nucleoid DNA-binding protein
MANRVNRDTLVDLVSQRSGEDVEIVGIIVDAFLDEIYQSIKRGEGVSLLYQFIHTFCWRYN